MKEEAAAVAVAEYEGKDEVEVRQMFYVDESDTSSTPPSPTTSRPPSAAAAFRPPSAATSSRPPSSLATSRPQSSASGRTSSRKGGRGASAAEAKEAAFAKAKLAAARRGREDARSCWVTHGLSREPAAEALDDDDDDDDDECTVAAHSSEFSPESELADVLGLLYLCEVLEPPHKPVQNAEQLAELLKREPAWFVERSRPMSSFDLREASKRAGGKLDEDRLLGARLDLDSTHWTVTSCC